MQSPAYYYFYLIGRDITVKIFYYLNFQHLTSHRINCYLIESIGHILKEHNNLTSIIISDGYYLNPN